MATDGVDGWGNRPQDFPRLEFESSIKLFSVAITVTSHVTHFMWRMSELKEQKEPVILKANIQHFY